MMEIDVPGAPNIKQHIHVSSSIDSKRPSHVIEDASSCTS
jgi:hypothetical protein